MKAFGIIAAAIAIILTLAVAVCLFMKIRLVAGFSKKPGKKPDFSLCLHLFGGKIKKDIFPKEKGRTKKPKTPPHIEKEKDCDLTFKEKVKKYYGIFLRVKNVWSKSKRTVRKRILVESLRLGINFGTGDAASTGIGVGSLWAAIYGVVAFLANFVRVTEPDITVAPDYENSVIDVGGECIIKFSLANLIAIAFVVLVNYYFVDKKLTKKEKGANKNVNTD